MSAGRRPAEGGSFDIHFDPDGTANFEVHLGGGAHVSFPLTRDQQRRIWARVRPALPTACSSAAVLAVSIVAVVIIAAVVPPPTTA